MTTTRDRLVDVAAGLLEEGGADSVTLREVGSRAGVSHNAPYKHFADKEALLAAVAAQGLRRMSIALAQSQTTATPVECVEAMAQAYVREAMERPRLFNIIYGAWRTGSAELSAAADDAHSRFVATVNEAQLCEELPAGDAERLAFLILSLAHGAAHLALAGHLSAGGKGHADPDDLLRDLFSHLRP